LANGREKDPKQKKEELEIKGRNDDPMTRSTAPRKTTRPRRGKKGKHVQSGKIRTGKEITREETPHLPLGTFKNRKDHNIKLKEAREADTPTRPLEGQKVPLVNLLH